MKRILLIAFGFLVFKIAADAKEYHDYADQWRAVERSGFKVERNNWVWDLMH